MVLVAVCRLDLCHDGFNDDRKLLTAIANRNRRRIVVRRRISERIESKCERTVNACHTAALAVHPALNRTKMRDSLLFRRRWQGDGPN